MTYLSASPTDKVHILICEMQEKGIFVYLSLIVVFLIAIKSIKRRCLKKLRIKNIFINSVNNYLVVTKVIRRQLRRPLHN